MPVYDIKDKALLEELQEAARLEGLAIANLNNALANGVTDMKVLKTLSQAMEDLHARKMQIYAQLEAKRLDK